jgi:hypothetical protein
MDVANKFNDFVTGHIDSLDPTINFSAALLDDNDVTVATSNCSNGLHRSTPPPLSSILAQLIALTACSIFGQPSHKYVNTITVATTHAIANTGATSILIMNGVDVVNKWVSHKPLTINMLDGRKVKSTHICDITVWYGASQCGAKTCKPKHFYEFFCCLITSCFTLLLANTT